jgi:hypothetical protein
MFLPAVFRIRIRDPGWVKILGSGLNNPHLISESSETMFWVKILKFIDLDPGSGMEIRIRDPGWNKLGSGLNIPDPQHCLTAWKKAVTTAHQRLLLKVQKPLAVLILILRFLSVYQSL